MNRAKAVFGPLPASMPSPDNPITPEKVKLGHVLYGEPRISVDGTVSCVKCHPIGLYAVDGLKKAVGNNCKPTPRNSPCIFNAAAQISEHWIGNRTSVEDQAKQALIGPPSYGMPSNELREFRMTREAIEILGGYDWPGNVRELRTAVEHAALVADDGAIRPRDLHEAIRLKAPAQPRGGREEPAFREAKREVVDRFEQEFLERLLDRHAGKVTEAAVASGMMRSALQRLLRKHRIRSAAYRSGLGPSPEAER